MTTLPICPREDCTASADHWHGPNSGHVRRCYLPEPAAPERCYAPRTTQPQPAAVVLPTVDEAARVIPEAWANSSSVGSVHLIAAKAVLDLIAARLPVWQPVEPGAVIKAGTRYCRVNVAAYDFEAGTTTYIDLRTVPAEPEDPAVAAVVEWLATCGPIDAGTDDARDLLASIDAARADA